MGMKSSIYKVAFYKVIRKRFVSTVGDSRLLFESLGSFEIKWKLFFKIDGIALGLRYQVLTNTVSCCLAFSGFIS